MYAYSGFCIFSMRVSSFSTSLNIWIAMGRNIWSCLNRFIGRYHNFHIKSSRSNDRSMTVTMTNMQQLLEPTYLLWHHIRCNRAGSWTMLCILVCLGCSSTPKKMIILRYHEVFFRLAAPTAMPAHLGAYSLEKTS